MRLPFALSLLLALPGAALADDAPPADPVQAAASPFVAANAVDGQTLDEARGGFLVADGLLVTLGIERMVSINGNVVERNELQLGDIGKLAQGNGLVSNEALGELRLIQNGVASALRGDANASLLGGTIIQNTLNDQLINSQTTLNATVNTAGMLRALNFAEGLNNALSTAVSPR
ncbi:MULTISPECIES: hypothetical protein [Massilia]|uniref:Secreted protein n=1 Tax=Massilia haematophila TaxID=457923 RepID=A0ABV7PH62_9BURK|nr:hypothetical protein [Massilia sp.]